MVEDTDTEVLDAGAGVLDLDAARVRRTLRIGARLLRKIEAARAHPLGLYRLLIRDDRGDAVTVKWFHEEWFEMVMQNRSVLLEAPRGTGKTIAGICIVLWLLGHNPNLRIKLVCEEDGKAKKRLRAIREFINENPLYTMIFPDVRIDYKQTNDKHTLNLVRKRVSPEPTIEAKGITSAASGDRADIMLCDDVCGYRNTLGQPAMRLEVREKFLNDWLPTLNPRDGRVIMIFTPWHEEDTHHHLKKTTNWAHKRYAHGKPNDPYASIFPELYPPSKLKEERVKMGSVNYSRAYLCLAIAGDTVIVQPDWLRTYTREHLHPSWLASAICIISVDPSSGRKAHQGKLDYTGVTIFLYLPSSVTTLGYPLILVPDSYHTRASTNQQVLLIREEIAKWGASMLLIEAQGMQNLHEWIERERSLNPAAWPVDIIPLPTITAKGQRLQATTPLIDMPDGVPPYLRFHPRVVTTSQELYFRPLADGSNLECERALRHQMVNFPAEHDDCMDSYTQGANYINTQLMSQDEAIPKTGGGPGLASYSITF